MARKRSPIIVSASITASNTDILQGTRLQTVPDNGVLTFELQASVADATNNFTASVQLPSGDTPMNAVLVPAGNSATAGIIDDRTSLTASFPVQQGGHCVLSADETGTSVMTYRVTYTPV